MEVRVQLLNGMNGLKRSSDKGNYPRAEIRAFGGIIAERKPEAIIDYILQRFSACTGREVIRRNDEQIT